MQGEHAKELERVRKLNYYYSHYSTKYGLYNPNAPKITLEQFRILFSSNNCFYCGSSVSGRNKTIDHKIPVSKGGTNEMKNLVICCIRCNSHKNNKLIV